LTGVHTFDLPITKIQVKFHTLQVVTLQIVQ
jgi:hypothetical protein